MVRSNAQSWSGVAEHSAGTETKTKHCQILGGRRICFCVLFILFSITVPVIMFYCVIEKPFYHSSKSYTCAVDPSYQVPCGLFNETCIGLSCCYDSVIKQCYHSIPARYVYKRKDEQYYSPTLPTTPLFTKSLKQLMLTIKEIDANRVQIILHDGAASYNLEEIAQKNYIVRTDNITLGAEVFHKSSSRLLLTTFRGPLIASEGYWEWTFHLTNVKLVGLGEIVLDTDTVVSKIIYRNENDHNTLPIFMAYSNSSFYGVVVEHQGLLEVIVLPSKLVILRSLAGSRITLTLCAGGENPRDVLKQLRSYDPLPVPYWILGAHICRDGITTMESAIDEYKKFIATEDSIHFASDCIHENLYFMYNGTTEIQENLKQLIRELQLRSHFMLSVTPHIQPGALYDKAVELDLLYYYNEAILNGTYLQKKVAYPDFTHKSISVWMNEVKSSFPTNKIDGFVLRSNWPVEENYTFINKKFRYYSKDIIESLSKTIPLDAYSNSATSKLTHFRHHNQYGSAQAAAFRNNLNYDFLMTSSYDHNVPDAALIQNVNISWSTFKQAISTTLYHSVFGSHLISIPVCGSTQHYNKHIHEELCIRWYLLAATFPVFRISSDLPRRDPSSLASKYAYNIARSAIQRRMLLSLYYYTALNLEGILVKPMFYNFFADEEVWKLDTQYMLGDALLVAHPVLPKTTKLQIYLPQSAGVWYEFWGGKKYNGKGWFTINVVESDWVMFIQQGHIVPLRNAKQSNKIGSYDPDDTYSFAIALKCTGTKECHSEGQLMLTSVSLKFRATHNTFVISNINHAKEDIGCNLSSRSWPKIIESTLVYGINSEVVTYSNFLPINLCEVNSDDIQINMFKENRGL